MRLIDADAAVERLQRRSDMFHFDKRYVEAIRDAIGEVLTMPTIDSVPVVRCKDCKYRCTEDLLGDAFALIRHLKAKVPKWISVKDELPPRELNILAVNGHGRIKIMALWKKEDKRWTWIEDSRFTHRNDITHWMPLPEPPKE